MIEVDIVWVAVCTILVMLMQVGFLLLEAGQVRASNNISVALKNLADYSLVSLVYWVVGFALMYGSSTGGLWGQSDFFLSRQDPSLQLFFVFQLMFCCTAVTIVSGAVAERMRISSYLIVSVIIAGLLYPLVGHWTWNTGQVNAGIGWLADYGFFDYAGSSVVHSLGGYTALAAILILGPRKGRFDENTDQSVFAGNNLPLAVSGGLFLFIGWLGFNGGNELIVSTRIPGILMNTVLAAMSGSVTACLITWFVNSKPDAMVTVNGLLAGLVSVTASCPVITAPAAVFSGGFGALIYLGLANYLNRNKVDDVVDAVPVHLGPGIWGTLSVALLASPELWQGELNRWHQLQIQGVGVIAIGAFCFPVSYVLLWLVNRFQPMRVSQQMELDGLDASELGIGNAMIDLARQMEEQREQGNFTKPIISDNLNGTSSIVRAYNHVISSINQNTVRLQTEVANRKIVQQKLEEGTNELQRSNQELERFASIAAHDLQEPLRKILAFGDRLVARCDNLDERGQDYLQRMQGAAKRMQSLIGDLLTFSRVTRQANKLENVDMMKIMDDILDDMEIRIRQESAKVEIGVLPDILADKTQMRQVFQNLISNALKFHQQDIDPIVTIHCRSVADIDASSETSDSSEPGFHCFDVVDNGIGFDEQYKEKIFDTFQRLHGRSEYEGNGIGLSIVLKIITNHGGKIWADSEVGKGTTFFVTLPKSTTVMEEIDYVRAN